MIGKSVGVAGLLSAVVAIGVVTVGTPAVAVESTAEAAHTTLVPIGGGYEAVTAQEMIHVAEQTASGPTLDILVVPSSYGNLPEDRAENLVLAQQRTDELKDNCEQAIDKSKFTGCTAKLLVLLDRADAENPDNSTAFDDPNVDVGFILGGDQVIAMQVLANTPAEAAMARAHARGVVITGTSAGNAVESISMTSGYTTDGQPWTGLQLNSPTIGWGDTLDTTDRGLSFGSQRAIFDQHFYQRGRFGRLLNMTAQSVDRYGNGGKLGIGADYATAPVVQDDAKMVGVIGLSSVAVFNYRTATKPQWRGADQTLSVRGILTHLIAPDTKVTYNLAKRTAAVAGKTIATPRPQSLPKIKAPGRATVLLGGGENDSADSAVLQSFAKAAKGSRVLVIAAGYADQASAATAADSYAAALTAAGWHGRVTSLVQGRDRITAATVRGAAGVVFVGGDQSLLAPAVADKGFADAVKAAVRSTPAVLTDGAMTAAMGSQYAAVRNPGSDDFEDEAIRYFRGDARAPQRGFGVISGVSLEPWNTYNYRWGVLFGNASSAKKLVALGVSEQTAISLRGNSSAVVGARSVVAVDGRKATFGVAPNGALTALNTYLSTFAPGDSVR